MSTGHDAPATERGTNASFKYYEHDGRMTVYGWYAREQTEALLRPGTEWGVRVFADGPPVRIQVSATYRAVTPTRVRARNDTSGGSGSGRTPLEELTFPDVFESNSPFPPYKPPPVPGDPPQGGGGGGSVQAPVIVRLYPPGETTPIQEWTFAEERIDRSAREMTFAPHLPPPGSPGTRKGWWRCTVTPQGDQPVKVYVWAMGKRGNVPIGTTLLSHRLLEKVLALAVEALTPDIRVDADHYLRVYVGKDLETLYGAQSFELVKDLGSAVESGAKLRSLGFATVPGAAIFADLAERRAVFDQRMRAARTDGERNYFKKRRQEIDDKVEAKRTYIQDDDIALRFDIGFQDPAIRAVGLDIAELEGEAGRIYFAFDKALSRLTVVPLLHVKFGAAVQPVLALARLVGLTDMDTDVLDRLVEDGLAALSRPICHYLKDGLGRAVGPGGIALNAAHSAAGWNVRYFIPPPPPSPTFEPRPPHADPGPAVPPVPGFDARTAPGTSTRDRRTHAPAGLASGLSLPVRMASSVAFEVEGGAALARLDRLDCLIFIMMENRSFDHMLGDLPRARRAAYDGVTAGTSEPAFGGFADRVRMVTASSIGLTTRIATSPNHHYDHVLAQMGGARGTMDGFARDVALRTDSPQVATCYYEEAQLPVYYRLVDEYKVCQRWFCAHPGPTWPNRWASLTGFTPALENFAVDDPRIGYLTDNTIFDTLSTAHVDWRYYESDLGIIRTYDRYRLDDTRVLPLYDERDGLEALLKGGGPLPRVIFVEPNFVDLAPIRSANDDHAPADLADGQDFIATICNWLWASPHWNRVALVITYDEHGGFYDHVPPPGTEAGGAEWIDGRLGKLHPDGPTFMGPRVPTFLVSPLVDAASISSVVFDHTSIVKSILVHNRAKIAEPTLASFGQRVSVSNHLGQALDRDDPRPPSPTPFELRPRGARATRDLPGWDERDADPRDFHAGLRRIFAPRRVPR
jgi:phospholipase C